MSGLFSLSIKNDQKKISTPQIFQLWGQHTKIIKFGLNLNTELPREFLQINYVGYVLTSVAISKTIYNALNTYITGVWKTKEELTN